MTKRRLLMLLVLLLVAGAIVNVAVAWGAAVRQDLSSYCATYYPTYAHQATSDDLRWTKSLGSQLAQDERLYWEERHEFGFSRRDLFALTADEFDQGGLFRGGPMPIATTVASGWPLLSVYGRITRNADRYALAMIAEYDGDYNDYWGMRVVRTNDRWYPPEVTRVFLIPIWPGFAINTVFYAAILAGGWGLFAAPFALRRRRRIQRGLCPACAYPVGDSAVCTECGQAVSRQKSKESLLRSS